MSSSIIGSIMQEAQNTTDSFFGSKKGMKFYIHSKSRIVDVELDDALMPKVVNLNTNKFVKLSVGQVKEETKDIILEYIIRIDEYYEDYTRSLYESYQRIEDKNALDLLVKNKRLVEDIMSILEETSLSGSGHFNNIVIRTNGLLENLKIFFANVADMQDTLYYKRELQEVLTDLYLNYLMMLNDQQRTIWEKSERVAWKN